MERRRPRHDASSCSSRRPRFHRRLITRARARPRETSRDRRASRRPARRPAAPSRSRLATSSRGRAVDAPRGRSVDPRGDASVHLGRRRRVFRACERRVHRSREMFSRGRVDLRGDDDEFGPRRRRRRGRTRGARGRTSRATDGRAVHSSRTPSGRTPSGRTPSGRTPSARSLRRGLERTVSRATRRVLPDGSRGGARARDDGTRRIARGGDVRRVANPRRRRRVRTRRRRDESREGRRRRRRRSPAPETGVSSRPRRGRSGRRPEGARRVDPPDRGRSRRSNARAIDRPDHALRTRVARARPANDGHGESSSSSPLRRRFFAADARASPVRSAEGGNPGEHIRRSRGAISSGGGGRSGRGNDRSRRARRSERSIGGSRETTRRRVAPRVFSPSARARGKDGSTSGARNPRFENPNRRYTDSNRHSEIRPRSRTRPGYPPNGSTRSRRRRRRWRAPSRIRARTPTETPRGRRRRRRTRGRPPERSKIRSNIQVGLNTRAYSERVSERVRTRVPAPAATKPPTTTGESGPGAVLAPISRERRRVDARRPPIGEHHVERNDDTSVTTCFAPISSSSALAWVPPTAPAGTRVTSSNVARFFARGRENAAPEGEEDDDEDARGE